MRRKLFYNAINHFKTITNHKLLVMKYCFKVGLYKQGLLHDLSKYFWVEFSAGIKYYKGNLSPNAIEKLKKVIQSHGFTTKEETNTTLNIGLTTVLTLLMD